SASDATTRRPGASAAILAEPQPAAPATTRTTTTRRPPAPGTTSLPHWATAKAARAQKATRRAVRGDAMGAASRGAIAGGAWTLMSGDLHRGAGCSPHHATSTLVRGLLAR